MVLLLKHQLTKPPFQNENTVMADIFNYHFREFIQALNEQKVEYVLVGGMAVILHGYVRGTGDMDVWVNKTKENYLRLTKAYYQFGMPLFDMTEENFLGNEFDVFSIGVQPVRIEVMTSVKGVDFNETYSMAQTYEEDGLKIKFIHINHLIQAKKASGRFRDLDDIEQLTKE
jgi:predicted nucleotidyltransferase